LLALAGNARVEVMKMRRAWIVGLVLASAGAAVMACSEEETATPGTTPPGAEGGADGGGGDSGPQARQCGDTTGAPLRMLVTIGGTTDGEMAAVNAQSGAVDGRLPIGGAFGGSIVTNNREPFVVAQEADTVLRLDPKEPWKSTASWKVTGDDAIAGGKKNANPSAVVVPACEKGYVLRFNRNKIAVIDTGEDVTDGAPTSYIDLSSQLQAEDTDGIVEMTSALWVESKKLVYVLLANVDLKKVATDGFTALCATSKPAIVAIDPTTDQVVGDPILLEGYNPPLGTPFWYDAAKERFLVLSAGCNVDDGSGGAGAVTRRRIEEVDIATGAVKTLLSLDDQGFPGAFEYIDATHAALAFFGQGYFWNPTTIGLGAAFPGGLDFLSSDGKKLFGARLVMVDGGPGPIEVVSADLIPDGIGSPTVIASDPFTKSGFMGSSSVWPKR
jgi:hypothetical protein